MLLGKALIDKAASTMVSRRQLAAAIGEDHGYLSRIENGKAALSPAVAAKLAPLAGLDPVKTACAALVEAEKTTEGRTTLARLLGIELQPDGGFVYYVK